MDKNRVAGLVRLYLHGGLPPNINVIQRNGWRGTFFVELNRLPATHFFSYRKEDVDFMPDRIVEPEVDRIYLETVMVDDVLLFAGFSDRFYTLIVAHVD